MRRNLLNEELNVMRRMMNLTERVNNPRSSADVYAVHIYGRWHNINEDPYEDFNVYDEEYEFGPEDYDKLMAMLPENHKYSFKYEKRYFDLEVREKPIKLRIKRGGFLEGQQPTLAMSWRRPKQSTSKRKQTLDKDNTNPLLDMMQKAMKENPDALRMMLNQILQTEEMSKELSESLGLKLKEPRTPNKDVNAVLDKMSVTIGGKLTSEMNELRELLVTFFNHFEAQRKEIVMLKNKLQQNNK